MLNVRAGLAAIAFSACMLAHPERAGCQESVIDPVAASPDKYKVLLENEHARVVEYTLDPGERDEWHMHPPKVSYVVSGGTLRITLADGSSFDTEEKAGSAVWMNAVPRHFAMNIGKTKVRIVLVEPKSSAYTTAPPERDPALVNPTSIAVKLENDSVRAMEAVLPPGFKETLHTHPGYVMYILDGGSVRLNMADGKTRDSEFKTGSVFYSEPITHWAENTGTTTIRVLLVELRRNSR
jgi:quercetin dioxygenase-like cupin family protein